MPDGLFKICTAVMFIVTYIVILNFWTVFTTKCAGEFNEIIYTLLNFYKT